MDSEKSWISKNKIFLIILGIVYLLMLGITILVINPGYKTGIILTYTFFFIFTLALYSLIILIYQKTKNQAFKGALIGVFIGIIAFIGSINWYSLCHRRWCDFMRNLSTVEILSLPFISILYFLFGLNIYNPYLKYISALVFIFLGILLGYIYGKNKKIFWISFIILIIAYIIFGLISLGMIFASFG